MDSVSGIPAALPGSPCGHRVLRWFDADRERPVWADAWYPAEGSVREEEVAYPLGVGRVVPDADLAASPERLRVVVLSPGAAGSADNYAWLAEHLARRGWFVLGVSHYGESWRYGPESVDPAAMARLWMRPHDCSFALDQVLAAEGLADRLDGTAVAALGHSSGGATAIALGGATFDPAALADYCRSEAAHGDRGCAYARDGGAGGIPPGAGASRRDSRVAAIVALDPAAGPAFGEAALGALDVPVLVVGSRHGDFLPYEHHAGRYARLIPGATVVELDGGEGHFVYLNACSSDIAALGVSLCVDRPGVDRAATHARLGPLIDTFLRRALV